MGKWEMVRLGDVCDVRDGTHDSPKYVKDGFPLVTSKNVIDGRVNFADVNYITKEDFDKINQRSQVESGDIIMPMIGTIGKPVIVNGDTAFAIKNVALIKFAEDNASNIFIRYLLDSYLFKCYVEQENRGGTQKFISLGNIRKFPFPLPPIDEQKRIVKNLDLASEIVKGYKEQLADLDKLVQSVFYEMFGDPVTNEKGWDIEPLSKTARIVTGNTPPRSCKDNYGHHIEWIKTDNITDALYITQASEYLSERGAAIGRLVDADAILMACIAGSIKSIGRVAIANRVVAFNQQINAVIANEYDTLFLYWLFKMTQGYIQSTINMSLKGILSKGKLEKLVFIVPPFTLQNRFASIVTEIEAQKAQVQQALNEAQTLFNSLMQEYFE